MNSPTNWLTRSVSQLRTASPVPSIEDVASDTPSKQPTQTTQSVSTQTQAASRSTHDRLAATLRRGQEALSPRALRRLHAELQEVATPLLSDIEAGKRAQNIAAWYDKASASERYDMWLLLCEQFAHDVNQFKSAHQRYEAAEDASEKLYAEIHLRRALASPRTRLLQRFAVFGQGVRFLVDMRAELLPHLKADKRLLALDAELEQLFSSWFDVAFLQLKRLSWDSPASLIEKLIKYEAVHDIRSWDDLKNRLDSDRRCYGFFHPRLPNEPLIFVEVALVERISTSITPLLDESAAHQDIARANTAIFYSISNTQTGLRGVSFGDSLIKHVVETLIAEFPRLRTFATLSPIPGFRSWLTKNADQMLERMSEKTRYEIAHSLGVDSLDGSHFLAAADAAANLDAHSPMKQILLRCAAHYLGGALVKGKPADSVARFHLSNGARIEQLNWGADPSVKGNQQSYGMMVNYLYDLKRLDKHRTLLAQGRISMSREIEALIKA